MPRDRMNRAEHRGFGFVTFETEAAIIRVASYGGHMIRYVLTAVTCTPVLGLCHTVPCQSSLSRVMQNAMVLSLCMSTACLQLFLRLRPACTVLAQCWCVGLRASLTIGWDCRGSVVAIDSAVPRRDQDGNRILVEDLSMPKRRVANPALDPAIVLELGPDRHHATDRTKHGYRPY
jgi:hypothetical protein